ncbi:Uma2 family endonuclease [Caldicellulosiruptor morganii]|uniref:Uma2 family endonuclease n=1 Tax=Caldicellulosiruptor morganii TaxID=1387555 RepID=A0ABY7BS82_9FIRM|nr:Uma2 family endonuclease [Caldicellulosiruptor morganii]WAM34434.1 Uma2 family endonuclease [Caldicellulosiruptor morganii]
MEEILPKFWTYEDYLKFPKEERVEIIDGVIYNMSPAPSRIHQEIIFELTLIIGNYIKQNKKPCKVYTAPFDVILVEEGNEVNKAKNVVQPDISIICDKKKLTEQGCIGTPDMIIEVVSQNNFSHDYIRKLNLYTQFKVKEYWIVNPQNQTILVYQLKDNQDYLPPSLYTFDDKIKVLIFDDLIIDFAQIKEVL